MNIHKNARLTPLRRAEMALAVIGGDLSQAQGSGSLRGDAEGRGALGGALQGRRGCRHGRPIVAACQVPEDDAGGRGGTHRGAAASAFHRQIYRKPGAGVSAATVSRVLKRAGLSRLKDIEPAEPVRRYERAHPGELLHVDIKTLGRIAGIGHRITGDRRQAGPRRRLGVRPRGHR